MLTRRAFLESSGLLAASSIALCRPALSAVPTGPAVALPGHTDPASAEAAQRQFLRQRNSYYSTHDQKVFLGYPTNMNTVPAGFLKWREQLRESGLGEFMSNNVGDPYEETFHFTSHALEADLINRFGLRFGFPADDTWGFVSHSGTDSNMHGVYMGRTLLRQRTGVLPKIYYTDEAHYSIQVVSDLLALEEVLVETNDDASMNMADLEAKLQQHRGTPVLLVATIGTTFKGGVDDIDAIQARLAGRDAYLHLDAALFGGYLHASPFAADISRGDGNKKRYDSIAVSCHKFFGFPSPAGLYICGNGDFQEFRHYFEQVHDPAYISHVPGTITCSRDAVKPAEFHYYCTEESLQQQQDDCAQMLKNTAYLQQQMQRHFPELAPRLANNRSNTVYFNNAISGELISKWTLATIAGSEDKGPSLAHAVVMPHINRDYLDLFLSDLEQDRKGPISAPG